MSLWTIAHGATEKSLPDWGLCADFSAQFASKTRDTLSLRTAEPFDSASPQWPWGSKLTVWRDRTALGVGGSIFFQGCVGQLRRRADAGREAIGYELYGPWWLLERLKFKQARSVFNGWVTPNDPTSGATLRTIYTTEVYLGEKADETWQTSGQQILEVLNWVNECYNPTKRGATSGRDNSQDVLAIGTIDPALNIPKSRQNDVLRRSPHRPAPLQPRRHLLVRLHHQPADSLHPLRRQPRQRLHNHHR